ncbi:MAG TPA: SDR family oxidoreductase [Bryobacteraceae bacterium]|nr:SDR family oxidoreductase [Bryobacteraceae bacterium]
MTFRPQTTALVTGGSRGIGRAICQRLASEGVDVIVHYHRNRAAAEEVGDMRLVQADLASPTDIERMFASLDGQPLDILVNNAGVWKGSPLGSTSLEAMNEIIDTNLKGPFWVMQCALPLLKDGARIVNISSVAARTGVVGRSLYGATKAAIDSLTRSWAAELAPRKILVNAVAPGYVTTGMTAEHFNDVATLQRALDRHPLGRLGTAEDIADVVAFLCSDDARFITGQCINVSGGFVL